MENIRYRNGRDKPYEARIRHAGKRISKSFHTPEEAQEWLDSLRVITASSKPVASGYVKSFDKRRAKLSGKRFVFTSAQNNTHIHEGFWASLQHLCEDRKAELVVSPFTYNKSGFQNNTKDGTDELWYDERLKPYFVNASTQVCPGLVFCGELDILPTAAQPLSGLESYCGGESGIVPHAKVAMISLPRMKGEDARFMYSTGTVTLRNYIQRKVGQKAEFHHVFGALYVEIDDAGNWFARQLIADSSGVFHDLTDKYTPTGKYPKPVPVEAINYGDIHVEKADTEVYEASFGSTGKSMLDVLQPKYQFIHDVSDFTARNHHNVDDKFFIASTHFNKTASVRSGIKSVASLLMQLERPYSTVVVVESNHDQALEKWLRSNSISHDPENASYWHMLNYYQYRAIEEGVRRFSVFETAVLKEFNKDAKHPVFLREDDSFVIGKGDIECGMHGHRGPNGARGASRSFRNIGRKVNLGHSHSAGIYDGVYVSGVSASLDMGYNKGPSSWSHSHILTYENGKRAIVTLKHGKWRAE